jgi:hypothetical protein
MSAIGRVSEGCRYDLACDMLATGASLASVYAAVTARIGDAAPVSVRVQADAQPCRETVFAADTTATVRPGRMTA